jgi:hypothetical protein
MTTITSCKDCFGVKTADGKKLKYQKPKCAYERAVDYMNAYNFFKEKWGDDFQELIQNAQALVPETNACKGDRNASMAILEQQEMFDEMKENMKAFNEAIKQLGTVLPTTTKKPAKEKVPNRMETWRPDIKEENMQDALDKLKERYPTLTEADIVTSKNKNNNLTIRYRVPAD